MSKPIKTSKFKYIRCGGGNLHDGQIMSLVCIDQRCQHRGIICPICKMQTHDDHYVLPIKSFLDQIDQIYMNKQGNEELNTIGDYLQGLQAGKRQLLAIIRIQVAKLSQIFKQIQCKIQTVYMSLRRNILIQSSINTKLPTLIELMKTQNNFDDFTIQNQFKKYCELIKVKDNKLKISDKSKKIVQVFKETPLKVKDIIFNCTEEYKNKSKEILAALDNQTIQKKVVATQKIFKFSLQEKSELIHVSDKLDEATGKQNCQKSFVFVDKPFTKDQNKVIFQVADNSSYQLLVAIANHKKLKQYDYNGKDLQMSGGGDSSKIKESVQIFFVSNGYTNKNEQNGEYSDDQTTYFPFDVVGTEVEVTYLNTTKQIQFKNIQTGSSFTLELKQDIDNSPQWRLCFGINSKDKIILKPSK